MALKVELKPFERVIIGTSVVTNGEHRTRLYIEGESPILREKDILTPETADTPAKRVYLAIQMMYLENDIDQFKDTYFALVEDIVRAAPSATKMVDAINAEIVGARLYRALKETKKLISYESELLGNAKSGSTGVQSDGSDHRRSA
jgi:flagellar protein FlbT